MKIISMRSKPISCFVLAIFMTVLFSSCNQASKITREETEAQAIVEFSEPSVKEKAETDPSTKTAKKKKFPILLIAGGAVVVAAVLLLIQKKAEDPCEAVGVNSSGNVYMKGCNDMQHSTYSGARYDGLGRLIYYNFTIRCGNGKSYSGNVTITRDSRSITKITLVVEGKTCH